MWTVYNEAADAERQDTPCHAYLILSIGAYKDGEQENKASTMVFDTKENIDQVL